MSNDLTWIHSRLERIEAKIDQLLADQPPKMTEEALKAQLDWKYSLIPNPYRSPQPK